MSKLKKSKNWKTYIHVFPVISLLIFQNSVVFGQSSGVLAENSCSGMESSQRSQKLSRYWAQEVTGSDLLRGFLSEKLEAQQISLASLKENFIVVLDTLQNNHHTYVTNLISDDGIHAVLPKLRENQMKFFPTEWFRSPGGLSEEEKLLYEKKRLDRLSKHGLHKENSTVHAAFINFSIGVNHDIWPFFDNFFKSLDPYSIVVVASGNEDIVFNQAPVPPSPYAKADNPDPIVVGSFSPFGFVSNFSFSGPGLHILAPSDKSIATTNANGKYVLFGGTSGAAPQVTGALAAFEWISGWHPSREEAKLLLEKTATPTIHTHEQPRTNGVGLLNAYKLAMVAWKLRKKCENRTCFQDEVRNQESEIYKFSPIENLEDHLRRAFPGCFGEGLTVEQEGISCEEKEKVFKKFRKAALLNPERKDLWEAVSCIYREKGFLKNSEMLERIALSVGSKEEMLEGLKSNVEKGKDDSLPYFFSETLKLVAGDSDAFFQ